MPQSMKTIVIIVDSKPERGKANTLAFTSSDIEPLLFDCKTSEFRSPPEFRVAERPLQVDLALVHDTSLGEWNDLQLLAKEVVLFSGGKEDWELGWLQRPLKGPADPLTKEEVNDLIDWILKGAPQDDLPALLVPAGTCESLIALAVLCQGYLAVWCEEHRKTTGGKLVETGDVLVGVQDQVRKALERMGWSCLSLQDRIQFAQDLSARNAGNIYSDICLAEWWNVFGFRVDPEGKPERDSMDSIENEFRKELCLSKRDKIPDELDRLLTQIASGRIDEVSVVASAYLFLANQLA